ncbi:MAG TPA: hypothetical protein VFD90_00935 [Gaiellales bacterium]|nr:hypothetical protein [Gaiellales bacterium]
MIGAVAGGVVFAALQAFVSSEPLSIVQAVLVGVAAGFVIGILPAAERDDAEQDRRLRRLRHGRKGPADATFEGQEARDLGAPRGRS